MNDRPYLLLAELTYGCPLHCPYCSNPVAYPDGQELSTEEWRRVFEEAAQLGVLHLGFSGGEPLRRADLASLVAAARAVGLYTNLITSALGLQRQRAAQLREVGLDSIQISFQAEQESLADQIAGTPAHAIKLQAAKVARELGFPLTVNVVLHRGNIDRLEQIIGMAERLDAERLELANAQYYGWAFQNRAALLPTRDQITRAVETVAAQKKRLLGQMEILFVTPDYYSDRPKPCMNGWGRRFLTVNPVGDVLPCPTASAIKGLRFDNIRAKPLAWIWGQSESFNRFRGTQWMPAPCCECPLREVDFGGCRCQAALLTGDAGATDPACALSPYREKLIGFVESVQEVAKELPPLSFRQNPSSAGP
ncbi:MAG: pyrroloquinoline quinone biosynthesis protein PqqE [Limisphaerales bacterium]